MEASSRTYAGFKAELRLSPLLITGILAALGTAALVISENPLVTRQRLPLYIFCIAAYLSAGLVGVLASGRTGLARAMGTGVLLVVIYGGAYGLQMPALLALTGSATVVAAALLGIPAAAATAVIEGLTLILLSAAPREASGTPLMEPGAVVVHLVALGVKVGLVYAIYHRIYDLGQWLWNQFGQAQGILEETRDRKAALQQAMEDLVHANRQLALANERMTMLRTVAENAQKSKTSFVANVSHEFRTPLNMIIGLVSLMIDAPEIYAVDLSPDMRKDLQIVHRNCEHLTEMINDVLNLSQVEAGRLVLHRERFRLSEIIDPAVSAVRPLLDKKQLRLIQDLPETLPTVYCDRTRIQQVILNLVSNAARFTEEGGITIRAHQADQLITIEVQDTGRGITPEDRERIFEPFCQGTTELWRDTGGSGLGLTISKQFIEAHGGRIWLESERGVGTSFYFTLPISDPVAPVAGPGRWIREDWEWRERRSRASFPDEHYRARIVVYDAIGDLHMEFARRYDDIDFVNVRDRADMLEALQECPAHAVIINETEAGAQMELVEAVRASSPSTPIVASNVPPIKAQAVAPGATGYLTKPITRSDLIGMIESLGRPIHEMLIVDDDADVLSLFTRTLHLYDAELRITTATGGQAALELVGQTSPDLLLVDLYMPDMDGRQVIAALRQDQRTADIPIYVISAHDPTERSVGSQYLLGAMGEQISVNKLLQCSLALSQALLAPDGAPDRGPTLTAAGQPAWAESERLRESVPDPLP